jgi:hypothetical protein
MKNVQTVIVVSGEVLIVHFKTVKMSFSSVKCDLFATM